MITFQRSNWSKNKQGWIHGDPVADIWAGVVIQKPLQECDKLTDRPTNAARCRVVCPRTVQIIIGKKVEVSLRLFDIYETNRVVIFLWESCQSHLIDWSLK